ncbi:DUF3775 domain-containing protein [Croceicoccus ponticola]|uniref:DUF3775 domain-containing protein n=1 Tax=Croceicoccus ponticola TaxID=2217664 RepID=A0A437H243_9SPHN|nr:DUF3775 domain-containing protein [Croceicoccus ponticola]RVQ69582.1 DUF3775 domain-containing protein [Croceicoccus ponticola]
MSDVLSEKPELSISADKVCFVVALARDFDVKEDIDDTEPLPDDDDENIVFTDLPNDSYEAELRVFIDELDEDEQIDLVALAWLGRGDSELSEWDDLRAQAAAAHNDRTAEYLMGLPILADLLQEGLSAFDLSCDI